MFWKKLSSDTSYCKTQLGRRLGQQSVCSTCLQLIDKWQHEPICLLQLSVSSPCVCSTCLSAAHSKQITQEPVNVLHLSLCNSQHLKWACPCASFVCHLNLSACSAFLFAAPIWHSPHHKRHPVLWDPGWTRENQSCHRWRLPDGGQTVSTF